MKKSLLSVQNNLLSEAIQNALVKKGRFCIENVSPNQDGKILVLCIAERVDVLLMDVTRLADSTIEKRLELCGKVKEYLPSCKTALLCDEQAYPDLADRVKQAKQFGKISSFFYSAYCLNLGSCITKQRKTCEKTRLYLCLEQFRIDRML